MKKPLQVGDRVAVYQSGYRHVARVERVFTEDGSVAVKTTTNQEFIAARQQCRLLVKPERRRVWVSSKLFESDQRLPHGMTGISRSFFEGYIEFVEVRKKKEPWC